jgi:heme/copper-type cytochrome/quinol oxidase subunit 2
MTIRFAVFLVSAACCVFAEFAILRSLLFGRARAAEALDSMGASRSAHASRPADIAWAILPAVGLAVVLYLTWRAVDVPREPAADVSHIGATIGV